MIAQLLTRRASSRHASVFSSRLASTLRPLPGDRWVKRPAEATSAPPVTRMFTTSSQFGKDQIYDKFTPRRPTLLNIKLPEEPYVPEEGPTIVSDTSFCDAIPT